ncbi:MAG: hypothetical protein Q7R96_01890 [Nanoarchaeota archaeon]|nr:hypothetical protein [Nanoarchaeota archaeon]
MYTLEQITKEASEGDLVAIGEEREGKMFPIRIGLYQGISQRDQAVLIEEGPFNFFNEQVKGIPVAVPLAEILHYTRIAHYKEIQGIGKAAAHVDDLRDFDL